MDNLSQQLALYQLLQKQGQQGDDKMKYLLFFVILGVVILIIYFVTQSTNDTTVQKKEEVKKSRNTGTGSVGIGTTTPPPATTTKPPSTNLPSDSSTTTEPPPNSSTNNPFPTDQPIKSLLRPNYCLDATSDDKVLMWECNGQDNQKWTLKNNQLKVKNKSDKCLTNTGGLGLFMTVCDDSTQQKWKYDTNSKQIKLNDSNSCLDIEYAFLTNGSKVSLYGCGNQTNQKFDANGGTSEDTSFLGFKNIFNLLWNKYCASWNGSQLWCDRGSYGSETLHNIIKNNDYTYSIKNKDNKFCRTDDNQDSRKLWCDTDTSNDNSKFNIVKENGSNNYLIKNKASDKFCYAGANTKGDVWCNGSEPWKSEYKFQFQS